MSDRFILFLASQPESLTGIDVHGFQELILSIHTLELNKSITGTSRVVLLVLVSLLQNVLGFCL